MTLRVFVFLMSQNPNISPSPFDRMAAHIGQALDQGKPAADALGTSAFEQEISSFVRQKNIAHQSYFLDSQTLWSSIENELVQQPWVHESQAKPKAESKPFATLFKYNPHLWIGIAAAMLLLAIGLRFLLLQSTSEAVLLAPIQASNQVVELENNTRIELRAHSKLSRMETSEKRTVLALEGEAFFDVEHNPDRIFVVKTPAGEIQVLGTQFHVETLGKKNSVALLEGSVQLKTEAGTVILSPSEKIQFTASSMDSTQSFNEVERLDWQTGLLSFENQALSEILEEVELQFQVSIVLSSEVAQERITGHIPLESREHVFEDLSLLLGGQFVSISPDRYRFIRN